MRSGLGLFYDDLIVGLDSLLEWAYPGFGFDYSECYEDLEGASIMCFVPFLRWSARVNQLQFEHDYTERIKEE